MDVGGMVARVDRATWLRMAGGAAALAVAAALYTRYSIDGGLSRDESVYVYGGQQLAQGVPPYVSIFDPKSPLATLLCGLGVGLANLFGGYDLHVIRAVFLSCAVLTVLAVYLLVERLANSVPGGLTAALVFASFEGFARDAAAGPDAKTPGVLFLVLCMWLAVRRNWFLAGIAGSLAFLVWQPLIIFPLIAVGYAAISGADRRRAGGLATLGGTLPVVATCCYLAAVGALGDFVDAAFRFPLAGVQRVNESFVERLRHIATVVRDYYNFSGVLFWTGATLLLGLLVVTAVLARTASRPVSWSTILGDPLFVVIGVAWLFEFGYALIDFQGYPDVYPLLPFPAIGIGVGVAVALRQAARPPALRVALAGAVGASLAALTVLSAGWFAAADNTDLRDQLAVGEALNEIVPPGATVYSLGTAVPLVMSGRRNPDRYIYLDSGVDAWKIARTPGGLDGWVAQILATNPAVIFLHGWTQGDAATMWLRLNSLGYESRYLGQWQVLVLPEEIAYARAQGVRFTFRPTELPDRLPCASTQLSGRHAFAAIKKFASPEPRSGLPVVHC